MLGCVAISILLFLSVASAVSVAWALRGSGVLTLVLSGVLIYFLWGSFRSTVSIDDASLRLRVPIYSATVPLDSVVASRSTILDLATNPELTPAIRTNGLGVPGYQLGHFRLRNGTRARVALTARSGVVYVPTNEGRALLISVNQPEDFIAVLRSSVGS